MKYHENIEAKMVRDVAVAKRYSVSRATIWRWVREGLLPKPTKIAGTTRFNLEACDAAFNKEAENVA